MTFFHCAWAVLLFSLAPFTFAAPPDTAFNRLVLALETAPVELRREFAGLALWHLADAYFTEAEIARTAANENPNESMRWSRSVEGYANELLLLHQQIEQGLEVSIQLLPAADAVIEYHGTRTMLTYPRPSQQHRFEQSLVEQFCQIRNCEALAIMPQQPQATVSTIEVKPDWHFTEDGANCSYKGLTLEFQLSDDPGAFRQFCTALFGEVESLILELKKMQQFGVAIDWLYLSIIQTQQSSEQAVQLNQSGDTVALKLPIIHSVPKLLPQLRTWLADHVNGHTSTLSLSATELNWQQGQKP